MIKKNILIILVLGILIYFLFFASNVEPFGDHERMKRIYGPHSSRSKYEKDEVYEIGNDNGTLVYSYNGATYKMNANEELEPYEPKKLKHESIALKIPTVVTSKKIKSQVPLSFENYKFRGLLANESYKQYYILYEREYDNYEMENKLFEYVLVKKIDGKYKIIHEIPPRDKIFEGDTIYFSYGNFQLGPLVFV